MSAANASAAMDLHPADASIPLCLRGVPRGLCGNAFAASWCSMSNALNASES
jgi:hypothetical protein